MSTDEKAQTLFSADHLSVFERHGATVKPREAGWPGCWVKLPNGWTLSIQWGGGMYGSNKDEAIGAPDVPPALTAEIAAWQDDDGLVEWFDGDTVQGWVTMDRVLHIIDLLAEDKLMSAAEHPDVSRADDQWMEPEA